MNSKTIKFDIQIEAKFSTDFKVAVANQALTSILKAWETFFVTKKGGEVTVAIKADPANIPNPINLPSLKQRP
jgi:hypothetical protein